MYPFTFLKDLRALWVGKSPLIDLNTLRTASAKVCLGVMLLFASCLPASLRAADDKQFDNEYGIRDNMYQLYQAAVNTSDSLFMLRVADSLSQCNDGKNEAVYKMLGASLRVYCFFSASTDEEFDRGVTDMKYWSRKAGFEKVYYRAYLNDIRFQLNRQRTLEALKKARNMMVEAQQKQNHDGIYYALCATGDIYTERGNSSLGLDYYAKALGYSKNNTPARDIAPMYVEMAVNLTDLKQYDRAVALCDSALTLESDPAIRAQIFANKCLALYGAGRKEDFMVCYSLLKLLAEDLSESIVSLDFVTIHKLILEGQYDEALRLSDRIYNKSDRWHVQERIYAAAGNYEKAYERLQQISAMNDSLHDRMQNEDLAAISGQLDNTMLTQKAEELEEKSRETTYKSIISIISIIVALLAVLALVRWRLTRKLRAKNKELEATNAVIKQAQDATEQAYDKLQKASHMRTSFIHNVTHELRTPLNAILGFAQILTDRSMQLTPENQQELLGKMQYNSDLLIRLIDNVLELSSLESDSKELNLALVHCNELGRHALNVSNCHGRSTEKVHVSFTTSLPEHETFQSNFEKASAVLTRLLNNAMKFTEAGSVTLHCTCSEDRRNVIYTVTDTGIGIPAEKSEAIFERFTQLDSFTPGMGIGLSICRLISEELGGTVVLDTEYHDGARFVFTLPRAR
jgi:signal transduction histidine kinase